MSNDVMNTGIYAITSPSGKCYVGSSVDIKKRWQRHRRELKQRIHFNPKLQSAYNKYGEENIVFTMLLVCSREDLIMYEQRAIDTIKPHYNAAKIAGSTLG